MVRWVVLVLLMLVRVASAQLGIDDVKDEAKRIDQRTLPPYNHALESRDVFASIHDALWHGAFKDLQRSHDEYMKTKAALDKSLAANDVGKAAKLLEELEGDADALDNKLGAYVSSSQDGVEKIQIGLGVVAFLIAGGFFLIFRRKKK